MRFLLSTDWMVRSDIRFCPVAVHVCWPRASKGPHDFQLVRGASHSSSFFHSRLLNLADLVEDSFSEIVSKCHPQSHLSDPLSFRTEHWAVRGDARWFVYSVNDLDPSSAAALGVAPDFDETLYDLQISGGLTFAF